MPTIAGCFPLALQIFLLLFKFSLQEMPDLLSTSAVFLRSPAGSAGLMLCVHRAGGERQTWTVLVCAVAKGSGLRLPLEMLDFRI